MPPPRFIGKVKLNRQGQLTLPTEARELTGIETDSDVYWYEHNNLLIVSKDLENQKDIEKKLKKK